MFCLCKITNLFTIFTRKKRGFNSDKNFMADGIDIAWKDTVQFAFPINGGRVIKVYDADTITIASKLPYDNSPLYRLSVRLHGIDTPEIKGNDVTDDEKIASKNARDFVSNLVLNKYIRLENWIYQEIFL